MLGRVESISSCLIAPEAARAAARRRSWPAACVTRPRVRPGRAAARLPADAGADAVGEGAAGLGAKRATDSDDTEEISMAPAQGWHI